MMLSIIIIDHDIIWNVLDSYQIQGTVHMTEIDANYNML